MTTMTAVRSSQGELRSTTPPSERGARADFRVVAKAVRDAGLLERRVGFYAWLMAGLGVALVGLLVGSVLLGDSWFQLLIAAGLGIVLTQIAFIAHEASHRQVLKSGPANDRLGRILAAGVVGISHQWWMTKHSRHHANPNQIGRDPDIEIDTISFLPSDAKKARGIQRWVTQRQGWLFFPLLTFEGANLHVRSIITLLERRPVVGRWLELGLIAGRFALLITFLLLVMPPLMALAFLGVQLAVFGIGMGASFAPNHKGMPTVSRDAKLDFFTKQVRTSRNIRGWGTSALMGGLNYQVEHHLFPNMARPHLRAASEIVRAHCREHGITYTETNMVGAYASVIRYLNRVGLAARDPFECPMLATRR
ncbi:acyl-CoA desaturase [Agrococcus sp. TF02-05]|uniref:fatty acid desaturase family protein n=1 Tax=Agrococcus sp. TF02-05 TaxID=2815211 RepID=UPI001AA173D9|nr:acyl-CoA desaturase [Agrococcus sp. TF02-05]MBO1770913.1 acyl-CoA desaturase [Agrococcus sp. TF02-05]